MRNSIAKIGLIGAIGLVAGVFALSGNRFDESAKPQLQEVRNLTAIANQEAAPTITMPPIPTSEKNITFVPASAEVNDASLAAPPPSEKKSEVMAVEEVCTGAMSSDFDCYAKYYAKLIKENGIPAAFDDLKTRYAENSYIKAQCHPLTHVIGRVAAQGFKTVGEAYQYGDSYCWSGYYHGVLESFVGEIGLDNLGAQIDKVCEGIPGKERYAFDYYNCVHGIGHGVMAITSDNLFESFNYCDKLTGSWEQVSCAGGVFMENVIIDGLNRKTDYLRPSEPLYPCTASPDKYKNVCYLMQTSYMLKVNGGNFKQTFDWCKEAGEEYRATCYQSLGGDASGRSTSNALATKTTCLLGEDVEQQSNCLIGAVKDFVSHFHSDTQAKELCASFENVELKEGCLKTAQDYYARF